MSKAFPVRGAIRDSSAIGQIKLKDKYEAKLKTPVTAIHFDEHSGMLVMATLRDRMIHFVSFACTRRPGKL